MKTVKMEIKVAQKLNIQEIIETYRTRLTGFIRKRVNRFEDAEDIVQDVFYQLAETERLLNPIDEVAAWLYTVARNRITDHYRKKKPGFLNEIFLEQEEDNLHDDFEKLTGISDNTPETDYLHSIIRREISHALADLPPEQREVFEMTEFSGISFKEISKIKNEPVNTLISRKRYAVLYLRERLRILYDELINF
jgi:RNA polymerase sigma factor (sigma-70 family)